MNFTVPMRAFSGIKTYNKEITNRAVIDDECVVRKKHHPRYF